MSQVEVKRRQIQAFSYILGIVALMVIGGMVGNNGIAYLAAALEVFSLVAIAVSECVPDALGRLIRSRRSKELYRNADKLRGSVMALECVLGLVSCVGLILLSDLLAEDVLRVPYSSFLLKLIAPALFFRALDCVLLAYFQGNGTQMPTVASCVLRPALALGVGFVVIPIFQGYGEKLSLLLLNDSLVSMYGAAGFAVSLSITEAVLCLLLFLVYLMLRGNRLRERQEGLRRTETFGGAVGALYAGMGPLMLCLLLAKLPTGLGIFFTQRGAEDIFKTAWEYGAYYIGYLGICFLAVFLCRIALLPAIARLAACVRKMEPRYTREVSGFGFHIAFVCGLFFTMYMMMLATPFSVLLGRGSEEWLAHGLKCGSVLILEAVLSYYFIQALLYTEHKLWAVLSLAVFLAASCVGLSLFVNGAGLGILGLVYAGMLGCGALCLSSGIVAFWQFGIRIDFFKWLLVPLGSAGISGLVCFFLSKMLLPLVGNLGTLIFCFLIGGAFYLAPQVVTRSFRDPELKLMPGGRLLGKISRAVSSGR